MRNAVEPVSEPAYYLYHIGIGVQHRMLNQIHVGHHYKVGLVVQFYIHACVKSACEEVELLH